MEPSSVSKTLEYAYDDWCMAQVARKLGKTEEAAYFDARAGQFANVFDVSVGFTRPRLADGRWKEPFNPLRTAAHDQDFIEGNAWQYTFYIPHDRARMVALYGGPSALAAKLDEMFATELSAEDIVVPDVSGLIGQYAHGNEPCHHVAYLYNDAGQPWKTQEMVARIKKEMYKDAVDGLCGNDDCGQMSAWYVWSALGFYPVCPGSGMFDIGSPSVRSAVLHLPGGKTFTIRTVTASGAETSPEDIYIQSMHLNGEPFSGTVLSLSDILAGGELVFTMGPSPKES
jgi:predicted alpha-1,2-mannosidase